jgi:hypothetical protein
MDVVLSPRQKHAPGVPVPPLWLENLPPEMMALIFSYLGDADMMTLHLVSWKARELVDKHWSPLKGKCCTFLYWCCGMQEQKHAEVLSIYSTYKRCGSKKPCYSPCPI